jgi:hypothetical protein
MRRCFYLLATGAFAVILCWLIWAQRDEEGAANTGQALPAEKAAGAARTAEPTVPAVQAPARSKEERAPLPNLDARLGTAAPTLSPARAQALAQLEKEVMGISVEFDPITGSPKWIASNSGLLTDSKSAAAGADADAPVRQFIESHREFFGHGAANLDAARRVTDYTTARSGSRKVIWHQQLDGIDIFEAVLQANLTAASELINISSQLVADPERAAGEGGRARRIASPPVTAEEAVAAAGANVGERVTAASIRPAGPPSAQPDRRQQFRAAMFTDAEAKLIWLPMAPTSLRLAWDVTVTSRSRGEMYRLLVDSESAEVLVRHSQTEYLSDATYRVYTSESPTPFSPGHETPSSLQPPVVSRQLLTLPALNTYASPNGWIDDGGNLTTGNNTDTYTDTNADNVADTPRTQGSPARVFDFPMSLAQEPSTYKDASVTQLFYWTNFAHDRLYDLGFTEAAGNFQVNNFGRGGLGNDPVRSEAQDGSGTDNANFSTPVDGGAGRMQMFNWTGASPDRDGSFEAEVVLHEYCHGLSNRLVGGPSVTISALASRGMGEGWSDYYGLALTAEASDNPHGNWARGGYSRYLIGGWYSENYYYGGRRYSYSTDMLKNPHTLRDIDPTQVDWHSNVPRNPTFASTQDATQVHYVGTVWAVMLWDMRANLILKHGFGIGNERAMFLVTEGMKLGPANPNLVQARDGIIQATLVNHPEDLGEVWTAFAKRGMGHGATAPASTTTTGLTESYAVPDDLEINDRSGFNITGARGGPFAPGNRAIILSNDGATSLNWYVNTNCGWLSASPPSGSLAPGAQATVTLITQANAAASGFHSTNVVFTNVNTRFSQPVGVRLYVTPPVVYRYDLETNPGWAMTGEWAYGTPTGGGGAAGGGTGNPDPTSGATGANVFGVNLAGNVSNTVTGPHYLTTAPVDLTHQRNTRLRFQRWLNNNTLTNSRVTVEISTDGAAWREVFVNPATVTSSTAWTQMDYDISGIADGQPAVRARWSYRTLSTSTPYSGWNIDDVEFLGETALNLALDFAPTLSEQASPQTATLTLSKAWPSDLTVSLTSSDRQAAVVPATVHIPAGQTEGTFLITPIDDAALDGDQATLITAAVAQAPPVARLLTVTDAATATLTLNAPAEVTEGAANIVGSLSVSAPVGRDVQVRLTTSSGALAAPAFITVPAGSSGPVPFTFSAPDNSFAEGAKSSTLTASVTGWTPGVATVNVVDDETPAILLTGPGLVREGDGAHTFTATVNTLQAADLVLALSCTNAPELTVPAAVTIPAGQFSATFEGVVVDDAETDGAQTATLSATRVGYASGLRTVTIADNDVSHYTFAPIASPQTRGVAFAVEITARAVDGAAINNHSGSLNLTSSSASGPVPFSPTTVSAFSNGVASASVTTAAEATGMSLTAADAGGRTGSSNAFDVGRGPALTVSPASINFTMLAEDAPASTPVTLQNPGTAANGWSATVQTQGGGEPALADVLTRINTSYAAVNSLIPNRYDFSEGVTGSSISDGGGDMYDGGNYLGTNITTAGVNIAYSDNVLLANANLGANGRYFTRKHPGLFLFVADVAGVSYFETTGNLGADGDGSTDTAVLTRQRGAVTYKGFVKRVYNAGDPSVNHLIILRDNGAATHTASTDTNDDFHRVSNLSGVTRIYYLLYASSSGGYINNSQTEAIMDAFLGLIGSAEWLAVSPASGTLSAGGNATVTATAIPVGLTPGVYTANLRFASQDVLAPEQSVPVTLTVAAPVASFQWATVPSPRVANEPFTATITARAADGSLVSAFNGAAGIAAAGVTTVTTSGTGTVSNSYPLTGLSSEARIQAIYTPAEVGPAGRLLSLGFDTVSVPGGAFTNFTIRVKHTTKANYSGAGNAVWESGGWSTVYRSTLSIAASGWQTLPLTTPFDYDGVSNLMVDISFDNAAAVTGSSCRATSVSPGRMLMAGTSSNSVGNPLDWAGSLPAPSTSSSLTNLRFTSRPFIATTPSEVTFTNGQWSGLVAVQKAAASAALRAAHLANAAIAGESNTFAVTATGTLGIVAPASGLEGDVVNASITVSPAPAADLLVSLASSDVSEVAVPASVTIPAGQASVPVTLILADDTELDGTQRAAITATAANRTAGTVIIAVNDNESTSVAVTLPASISEAGPTQPVGGTITLGAAPAADVTLTLASSDPVQLVVPPTVTVPAGQSSAKFAVIPINEGLVDGNQVVAVTATLPGSAPGAANITVIDDEARTLTISLTFSSRSESSGTTTAAGTVSLTGTAVAPVSVTLTSSDLTELQHSSATINAGSSSASFNLTAVDDLLFDGTQTVTITASAATFTNGTRTINITDDDAHNFLVSAVASPQVRGAPFNVTFTARDINNATITGYVRSPVLTSASGGTSLAVTPGVVTGFSNGVKTQSVAVLDFSPNAVITLTDTLTGGAGSSVPFVVTHGPHAGFVWNQIPTPQEFGTPLTASLAAVDAQGNTCATFTGTASLQALAPFDDKFVGGGLVASTLPLATTFEGSRSQIIYTASELGGAQLISGIALEISSVPGIALSRFGIRLKHTSISAYNSGVNFDNSGLTLVYQRSSQTITSTGWQQFNFDVPFSYSGSGNLLVDIVFDNASTASAGQCRTVTVSPSRHLYASNNRSSGFGDPYNWNLANNSTSTALPNIQLIRASSIPVTPAATGTFTAGVWTGTVNPAAASPNMRLLASAAGITGISNFFDVTGGVPLVTAEPSYTAGTSNQIFWLGTPPGLEVELQRATFPSFSTAITVTTTASVASSYTFNGMVEGAPYYYRARSKFSSASPVLYSPWSNTVSSIQDATAPLLNIDDPGATVTGSSFLLTGSASDSVSGIGSVTVGGVTAETSSGFANWSSLLSSLAEGANNFEVVASDQATPPNTKKIITTVYRISSPEEDSDRDGIASIMAHALGIPAGTDDPRSLLPVATMKDDGGQRCLTMDYRRRVQRGGLQYLIETSGDLRTWTPVGSDIVEQSVTPNGDGLTETVRIRVIPALGVQGATFVRLRVVVQ